MITNVSFVDKVNKKTLTLGIEDNGIFRFIDGVEEKEYALMENNGQNSSDFWHQRCWRLNLRSFSKVQLTTFSIYRNKKEFVEHVRLVSNTRLCLKKGRLGELRKFFS